MECYVVRVWLPDRPGALGAVASRIGAVRGDVVGIDILETGGGEAIDELVVHLPQVTPVALLVSEIEEVDGARVEEVRPLVGAKRDPHLAALETAARLVAASTSEELLALLCEQVGRTVAAEWVAVVDLHDDRVIQRAGAVPPTPWLAAFLAGSRSAVSDSDTDDVVWAPMPDTGLAVVAGRNGSGYRSRERGQLAALARIADLRHREVAPPSRPGSQAGGQPEPVASQVRERSTARSHWA